VFGIRLQEIICASATYFVPLDTVEEGPDLDVGVKIFTA